MQDIYNVAPTKPKKFTASEVNNLTAAQHIAVLESIDAELEEYYSEAPHGFYYTRDKILELIRIRTIPTRKRN
jgi:hypothetical protein